MAFNTGLSGLRAASVDLDVTGNNIANASTVGFKGSKAQFGDLYASGFLSAGTAPVGDGVRVQDVKQSFSQGNISFTDSGLDMAISGDGFFILNNGGETRYSRAGQFGIDKDGFVTNNQGMRVQGYTADDTGNLSGIRGDLRIEADNLAPRRTTNLRSDLNLDSRETVLERRGTSIQTVQPATDAYYNSADETVTFTQADGRVDSLDIPANSSADTIAGLLSSIDNVSASARTLFTFAGPISAGSSYSIQGQTFDVPAGATDPLQFLVDEINGSNLDSIFASPDGSGLQLIESRGSDITFADGANPSVRQVGSLTITLGRDIDPPVLASGGAPSFMSDPATEIDGFVSNEFNPLDQRTYNHATSTTIYDSLGNSHELTQFFVKEPSPGLGVGVSEWSIYLQIDGEMVAGTDSNPYTARFDQDGALQSINGNPDGEIIVDDWVPKDAGGLPNGSDGPPSAGETIVTPIPEPPTTSAFVIDLSNTSQYGATFGVNDQRQNGYTTGRLSGLDVSEEGVLFARYTNGQSQSLGQVALASFNNTNGLSPVGETTWVETFESGQPIVGAPDTGTLGSITASSVEESNVDLSAELVNLIIAQRNYQANAKTIETSDAVTQTIINLR